MCSGWGDPGLPSRLWRGRRAGSFWRRSLPLRDRGSTELPPRVLPVQGFEGRTLEWWAKRERARAGEPAAGNRPSAVSLGDRSETPLSEPARDALDSYLERSLRVGEVLMFPSPQDA